MSSPTFARHETFHPRYGWLKKGFDAAEADPEAFLHPDAHVRLGVGKNMVRAIRYWCHAFKVLEEDPSVSGRAMASRPSTIGQDLLGKDGLDPYMEDLGTLWLLHWQLLRPPCSATAWWYAFFIHARSELSVDELSAGLSSYVESEFPAARAAKSSLRKDASCIVRMYGEISSGPVGEESIHCPWAELRMMRPVADRKAWAFRVGRKPGLTPPLIAALCFDYAAMRGVSSARTFSVGSLTYGPASPGLALKLPENVIYSALEEAAGMDSRIGLSDTAGVVQLTYDEDPRDLHQRFIRMHYEESRQGAFA